VTVRLPAPGPIAGTTALPAGFAHPHASEEARRIAEAGLILRVQVGSGVHGTAIDGQDDRDELGLCLEPPTFVTGLARVLPVSAAKARRYASSSMSGTPRGTARAGWRTGPAPATLMSSSTPRKWARLALAGNPTVLGRRLAPPQLPGLLG
jgi:hypothetical protein